MTSEELAREITETTINAEVDPDTVFTALEIVFMFWISSLCADCRREVARKSKASIPKMLDRVDRVETVLGPNTTCH
jgi:hypothetical protein